MVFGKVSYKAYNLHHGFKAVKKIIRMPHPYTPS